MIQVIQSSDTTPERPYISVGAYKMWNFDHSQVNGIRIWVYPASGGVKTFFVDADTRHEPETRNHGGGLGAYRDIEPSEERVQDKIDAAKRYIQGCDASAFLVEDALGSEAFTTFSAAVMAAEGKARGALANLLQPIQVIRKFDKTVIHTLRGEDK